MALKVKVENCKIDTIKHCQPMKIRESWRDTVVLPSVRNTSCRGVLDTLWLKNLIFGLHKVNCYSNLVLRSQKHELMSEGIPLTKILKFDGCYEYDRNKLYIFGEDDCSCLVNCQ